MDSGSTLRFGRNDAAGLLPLSAKLAPMGFQPALGTTRAAEAKQRAERRGSTSMPAHSPRLRAPNKTDAAS